MRAKLKIESVVRTEHSETLKLRAISKSDGYGADGLDENNTFAKYTPTATLEMQVTNPALLGTFNPGDVYYLDFTKVTETKVG